jgi:hypothetical protein
MSAGIVFSPIFVNDFRDVGRHLRRACVVLLVNNSRFESGASALFKPGCGYARCADRARACWFQPDIADRLSEASVGSVIRQRSEEVLHPRTLNRMVVPFEGARNCSRDAPVNTPRSSVVPSICSPVTSRGERRRSSFVCRALRSCAGRRIAGSGLVGLGTGSGLVGLGTGSGLVGLGTGSGIGDGSGAGVGGLGTGSGLVGLGTGSGIPGFGTGSGSGPSGGSGGTGCTDSLCLIGQLRNSMGLVAVAASPACRFRSRAEESEDEHGAGDHNCEPKRLVVELTLPVALPASLSDANNACR